MQHIRKDTHSHALSYLGEDWEQLRLGRRNHDGVGAERANQRPLAHSLLARIRNHANKQRGAVNKSQFNCATKGSRSIIIYDIS